MRNDFSLIEYMDAYSNRHKMMRTIAKNLLGPYYGIMEHFFQEVFFSTQYRYCAFVARRSICLAELFFTIFWFEAEESGNHTAMRNLQAAWTRFTTDSTILSCTDNIAQDILRGKRNKILLVDDILVQGNGLNELLSALENGIIDQLQRLSNNDDIAHYYHSIVSIIQIRVLAQNSKLSLVKLRYQLKLKAELNLNPKDWHDLSQRISNTIVATGLANATFIMGAELPASSPWIHQIMEKLSEDSHNPDVNIYFDQNNPLFKRIYWGLNNTAGSRTSYYCSIRIIYNAYTDTYRFMPFVFLPELSDISYRTLRETIFRKWEVDYSLLAPYSSTNTSRLEYEAMILHLSESLLVGWMNYMNIPLSELRFDTTKIMLNYAVNLPDPKITDAQLKRLTDPYFLFSGHELFDILDDATWGAFPLGDNPDPEENCSDDAQILDQIKDTIYQMKLQELTESYRRFMSMPPERQDVLGFTLADNTRNNWNIRIEDFIDRMQHQIKNVSMPTVINNLLDAMDYGYVTLRIRKSNQRYTQVLRMGERALFIWPMRYDKYLPVLTYLQQTFEGNYYNLFKHLCHFLNHEQQNGTIPADTNTESLADRLIDHLVLLHKSGQSLDDWDIRYDKPTVFYISDKDVAKRITGQYLKEQLQFMAENSERRKLLNDCLEFYPS